MSRYATAILCLVLIGHVMAYSHTSATPLTSSSSENNNQQDGEMAPAQQPQLLDDRASAKFHGMRAPAASGNRDIDLNELTPSLEQQLYRARQLNGADPESIMVLNKPAEDTYRYELVAAQGPESRSRQQSASSNSHQMMVQRPTSSAYWMDRMHTMNNVHRRNSSNSNNHGTTTIPLNYNNQFKQRFSRDLSSSGADGAFDYGRAALDKEDKEYEIVAELQQQSRASPNQEGAARKSLWTSELLRDLLISQEERNRARYFQKLERAYERLRGANQNSLNGVVNQQGPMKDDVWQREKKRRCKVDPNLGVKNPSYCDTDAYFGAADYGMRDVWDSAGR